MIEQWDEIKKRHRAEKRKAVTDLSDEGLTKTEAANRLGCSPRCLCNFIRREGIGWAARRQGMRSR